MKKSDLKSQNYAINKLFKKLPKTTDMNTPKFNFCLTQKLFLDKNNLEKFRVIIISLFQT